MPGCLVSISAIALNTIVKLVALHTVLPAGHAGSPPPLILAVFLIPVVLAAVAATATGMSILITPALAPAAITQPVISLPLLGQPLKVPPVIVGVPLKVIPVGKLSVKIIGAVVGPLLTVTVNV